MMVFEENNSDILEDDEDLDEYIWRQENLKIMEEESRTLQQIEDFWHYWPNKIFINKIINFYIILIVFIIFIFYNNLVNENWINTSILPFFISKLSDVDDDDEIISLNNEENNQSLNNLENNESSLEDNSPIILNSSEFELGINRTSTPINEINNNLTRNSSIESNMSSIFDSNITEDTDLTSNQSVNLENNEDNVPLINIFIIQPTANNSLEQSIPNNSLDQPTVPNNTPNNSFDNDSFNNENLDSILESSIFLLILNLNFKKILKYIRNKIKKIFEYFINKIKNLLFREIKFIILSWILEILFSPFSLGGCFGLFWFLSEDENLSNIESETINSNNQRNTYSRNKKRRDLHQYYLKYRHGGKYIRDPSSWISDSDMHSWRMFNLNTENRDCSYFSSSIDQSNLSGNSQDYNNTNRTQSSTSNSKTVWIQDSYVKTDNNSRISSSLGTINNLESNSAYNLQDNPYLNHKYQSSKDKSLLQTPSILAEEFQTPNSIKLELASTSRHQLTPTQLVKRISLHPLAELNEDNINLKDFDLLKKPTRIIRRNVQNGWGKKSLIQQLEDILK